MIDGAFPNEDSTDGSQSRSLGEARRDRHSLGQLLDAYRPYLLHIANDSLPEDLRGKAGASDLVQQTFLEAHRDFVGFRGETELELRAWLKQILSHNLANLARQFRAQKRYVGRELDLSAVDRSLPPPEQGTTASSILGAQEEIGRLDRALAELSPEHRQVILLRNRERCSFPEIGRALDRSPDAARKLWARAIERLQEELARGSP